MNFALAYPKTAHTSIDHVEYIYNGCMCICMMGMKDSPCAYKYILLHPELLQLHRVLDFTILHI